MTSNLGATAIREEKHVGFNVKDISKNHELMQKRIMEELKKAFRPEFLNRIDETILFTPLSLDNVKGIIGKMTAQLAHRLEQQEIVLEITDEAKTWIA
ncbi:AAA family ATPase, partial [Enterococcus faecalis]|uniref:AAA family ATPase n=1 Tax=Enterococcus faecalis TaxID=1351 RepID=UPI00100257A0